MRGKFIVFEGPDGCGKSTMLEAARRHLAATGRSAVFVQDPGGTEIGAQIRKILLSRKNESMCAATELLLYVASRAQLAAEVIVPALERGETVISDRYTLSTLVYQGVSRSLPETELRHVTQTGLGLAAEPDMVILLDVPVETGMSRVGGHKDRMEAKGDLFHQEVRQRYLGFAAGAPEEKVRVVDANRTVLEVKKEVLEILDEVLC